MVRVCRVRSGGPKERARHAFSHPIAYGNQPQQFGDLYLPDGRSPSATVVLIHGGFLALWSAGRPAIPEGATGGGADRRHRPGRDAIEVISIDGADHMVLIDPAGEAWAAVRALLAAALRNRPPAG
jgi:hypothetical protein